MQGKKKKQIMGIFFKPYCLTHHLLETRGWREQKFPKSDRQFSPAAYNLFYSPSPDTVEEESKKCCTSLGPGKEDQNVLPVEEQELILLKQPLLHIAKSELRYTTK